MWIFRFVSIIFVLCFALLAQGQVKTTPPRPPITGALTGKVFAITKGGDVKPALMAHVYLYSESPYKGTVDPMGELIQSLLKNDRTYEESLTSIVEKADKKEEGNPYDDKLRRHHELDIKLSESCHNFLRDIDDSISSNSRIGFPFYSTDTDETGVFNLSRIKLGKYWIVVRGQAGSSDVLWVDEIVVKGATTIKLSSVAKACQ
jgi:hypothetical protein